MIPPNAAELTLSRHAAMWKSGNPIATIDQSHCLNLRYGDPAAIGVWRVSRFVSIKSVWAEAPHIEVAL